MLGTREIIIIAVVIILLFGAKKIPELAKAIGQSVGHLKKGLKEGEESVERKEDKK